MTTQQRKRPGRAIPAGDEQPPAALTLDQVFAHTAERHASRVAVQDGWHRLTYAQAERQAVRLASALVVGGLQLGEPLVVHCENHRQALVAQLAVLKAGAVCVPAGPNGIATAVRETGARAVLCSRSTYDPNVRDVPSLALDDPSTWRKISSVREEHSLPRSSPEGGAHLLLDGEEGDGDGDGGRDHGVGRAGGDGGHRDRSGAVGGSDGVREGGSADGPDGDPGPDSSGHRDGRTRPDAPATHSTPTTPRPRRTRTAGPGRLIDHRSWLRSASDRSRRVGVPTGTVTVDQEPMSPGALAAMWWAFSCGGTLQTAPWGPDAEWPLIGGEDSVAVLAPEEYARHLDVCPVAGSGPGAVVLIGGPCSRELVSRHFAARPHTRLWSEFAPTDGAVPWTAHELFARDGRGPREPGAGTPVPPVRLRVAGARGESLPQGTVGTVVAIGPTWWPGDVQRSGWQGRLTPDRTLDITARPAPDPGAENPHRPPVPTGRLQMEVT